MLPSLRRTVGPSVRLDQVLLQVESLRKELRADRWNFVQLPWGVLKQELQGVTDVRAHVLHHLYSRPAALKPLQVCSERKFSICCPPGKLPCLQ